MGKITKDILEQLDDMTDDEIIEALDTCTDYGLGDLLGDTLEYNSSLRREELGKRMNEQKLECPECNTRQVQLVGYIDIYPAQWKCRRCKHNFEWEGA